MLTSLRIQNFRSIRDASVKLGQVNLFIGPNNSGKSNFLKGIEMSFNILKAYPNNEAIKLPIYESSIFRTSSIRRFKRSYTEEDAIKFVINSKHRFREPNQIAEITILNVADLPWDDLIIKPVVTASGATEAYISIHLISTSMSGLVIYKPDPAKFQSGVPITNEISVSSDCSNLVAFLFYLSQNFKTNFKQLEKDLSNCIGSLVSISTPADPDEPGKLKIKFFDNEDRAYWAEEVSEGVLYFLALLCIVHQPDPPKLLLLEEPEKGIHPRRIKEVMDFIFELARLRDIQIILTSHSPYVVDHFADIPECISVFDREDGETVIRNAGDIITETNAKLVAEGKKPIRYTDSLGEHWVSGFLGGVPA